MPEASIGADKQKCGRHEYPVSGNFETFISRIQSPNLQAVAQFWHEARGNKQMPSWTDIESPILSPYSRLLWSYSYDAETGEFTGRSAGRFSKWVGGNFCDRRLQDICPPSTYGEAQQFLIKLVTTPLAGRFSGRLFKVGDFTVTGERIILPLAADGKTGDGVLGASDYVPPPLLGPFEMILENMEWYAI